MRRWIAIVGALVVVLAAAGVGVRSWILQSNSTSVDEHGAIELAGIDQSASAGANKVDPGERPDAGIWRYEGAGRDAFEAFGGASHQFPDTIFTVVSLDEDDRCVWEWFVPFVEEHTETRSMCTVDGSLLNARFSRSMTFLGREQESRYRCDENAWRVAPPRFGRRWSWTCAEARGGVVRYSASDKGERIVTIEGQDVTTRYVEIRGTQRDRSKGDELTRLWLLESGIPARFATRRSAAVSTPVGVIQTSESWDYTLAKRPN